MREEYMEYINDLPIKFSLLNIKNHPMHWHDYTEILFVLKGKIELEIGNNTYYAEEREIEIVNRNEIHAIKSHKDNLVLKMDIDSKFFEKYYEGADEVYFYTDSSNRIVQNTKIYEKLRQYISILYYEFIKQYEDSKEVIEEELLSFMYYLLNNFHYLFYEEESLREDDIEFERYHRIVKYIRKNYKNKISLKDLAEREFLTSQYLSYKIKNTFGYSFIDFLNSIRVEESIKLLLDSDKSISEISENMGFSHMRYYNKHFKIHHNLTPVEYRKKYKLSLEELNNKKELEKIDLKLAVPYLKKHLQGYTRYKYDDHIEKHDIFFNKSSFMKFRKPDIFKISLKNSLSYLYDRNNLIYCINDLKFKYAIIEDIDYIVKSKSINWSILEAIIEFLSSLSVRPIIFLDGIEEEIKEFQTYIKRFNNEFYFRDIIFTYKEDFYKKPYKIYKNILENKDSLEIVGKIIEASIFNDIQYIPKLVDDLSLDISYSDSFVDGSGLVTINNLKKPSYYIYKFLSLMGDEIIYIEENCVVTTFDKGYSILLFDSKIGENLGEKKRFSLNILGMEKNYRIIKYNLNKDYGSVYDKWTYLGSPKVLSKRHREILNLSSFPNVKFYYTEKESIYNISASVKDGGAILYVFEEYN